MDPEEYNYVGHLANQVFSNHLLVKTIWRHFSVESLKTLSLVCRRFCTISRKLLRDHKFLSLGISISFDGPCKRLETAEEIIGNSTDNPYNGIALFKPKKLRSFQLSCLTSNNNYCREGNVEEMYPNILQHVKWKSIKITVPEGNQNCPSLKLFWMLIFQNAKSVKRLCFSGNSTVIRKKLEEYIQINGTQEKPACFPELEILEINFKAFDVAKLFLLSSPKLTVIRGPTIIHYLLSYYGWPFIPKEKSGMFTYFHVFESQELVALAATGMRLEKIKLINGMTSRCWPEQIRHFQTSLTLPQQMFTKTLTKISTWCRNVAFIASRAPEPFLKLEYLSLRSSSYFTLPDPPLISISECALRAINFDRMFPHLRKMTIKFLEGDNAFLSPEVTLPPGLYQSSSVSHLKIIHKLSEDCLAEIARIFAKVELLEIIDMDHVPMASRQDLQKIFRFWGSSGHFKGLKTLRLVCSLPAVRIDDYMGYVECEKSIGDMNNYCRLKFTFTSKQFSMFNKNHLRRIEIHLRHCRTSVLTPDEATQILSIQAAKMIRAKLPEFVVTLRFLCRCEQCHEIDEAYFKYLTPFTTITRVLNPHGLLEIKISFDNDSFKI